MVTMFVLILDVGVMARETVLMDSTRPTVVRPLITQQIALLCFVLLFASDKNLLRVDDKKCKQEVPQLEDSQGYWDSDMDVLLKETIFVVQCWPIVECF